MCIVHCTSLKRKDSMIWNKKFIYPPSTRSLVDGKRHYDITGQKLPSVTTILSATQSEEKKKSLANWQARMGKQTADRIRDISAMRGTIMHTYLEGYINNTPHLDLTSVGKEAGRMANIVVESGLGDLGEVWGSEVTLYYPGLYAGQTEWIDDYFTQLAAYAMAHNHVYGTAIQSGVILMCSKDGFFQKFEVFDKEFQGYMHTFLKKVDQYYANVPKTEEAQGTKYDQKV
jgi:hypothetical protein